MDSPQYLCEKVKLYGDFYGGFKPYYKWIVLNTNDGVYSMRTISLF